MSDFDMNSLETIEKLFKHDSLLDILLEFERFLDNFHIYAYDGWFEGEVVGGPKVERYWVRVILMFNKMPDPMAGMALVKHGCKVKFKKGTNVESIKIETPSDYREDGSKKPKMKKKPVWFVEITIPRRFIDEIDIEDMSHFDDGVDVEDVESAEDQGLEQEGLIDDGTSPEGMEDELEI